MAVGPRVFLRPLAESDREAFTALRVASRAFLEPWEGTPPGGGDNFTPAYFERILASQSETNRRLVIAEVATGDILGHLSLGNIVRGAFQSGYVGYWIGARHAGRGYMTEALALAVAHAFVDLKLHRVEANIVPENAPSKALVKKLGFRREGIAKRYLCINGRWRDHEHWAMTVEDWSRLTRQHETYTKAQAGPSKKRPSAGS